jgi:hypothetical protein
MVENPEGDGNLFPLVDAFCRGQVILPIEVVSTVVVYGY